MLHPIEIAIDKHMIRCGHNPLVKGNAKNGVALLSPLLKFGHYIRYTVPSMTERNRSEENGCYNCN